MTRKPYPSNVSDEEWSVVAPSLTLMTEDAPQRNHSLREVFNGFRRITRTGASWRMLPNDLPPWHAVDRQPRRWLAARVFETLVHDVRIPLRAIDGRAPAPRAVIADARTMPSTPEGGARAGDDGHQRRKGGKVHLAGDALGQRPGTRPGRHVGGPGAGRRWRVVEVAFADQGYTGEQPAADAHPRGTRLEVRQTAGRQTRLRAAAAPLGGGAQLRPDGTLSLAGARR